MAKASKTATPANREILEAALQGLELQREKLEQQIAQVRSMLGGSGRRPGRPPRNGPGVSGTGAAPASKSAARERRQLSPEARKRIAAAQKKRWAAFRKAQ